MGCNVFANGDEISCKAGGNKVIAAFPDVCLTPPPPPAGPLPVPYPDTSFSKDMKSGSKTVEIGGQEVMLKDSSFYKSSPLGDEAATNGQGANVVTHVITSKTYFAAWSMDVKFEDENVDRHSDLTTSNHDGAQPGGVPKPDPSQGDSSTAKLEETECPCCHKKPAHAHQIDPSTGKMYEKVPEKDWYGKGMEFHETKLNDMVAAVEDAVKYGAEWGTAAVRDDITRKHAEARKATDTMAKARAQKPPCPNLHDPPDEGCGTHFIRTSDEPGVTTKAERAALGFTTGVRNGVIRAYKKSLGGTKIRSNSGVAHKTPLSAGGCPDNPNNLIPNDALSPECQAVDTAQEKLQGISAQGWRGGA